MIYLGGKIFSVIGILGIIATLIISVTEFSSSDYALRAVFVVVGILLSIVIVALGVLIDLIEKHLNKGKGEKDKE